MRAANRGSENIQILNQNITSAFNEKTIFVLSFLLFFFETADLRSYCSYFLAICQLCLVVFFIKSQSPMVRGSLGLPFKHFSLQLMVFTLRKHLFPKSCCEFLKVLSFVVMFVFLSLSVIK